MEQTADASAGFLLTCKQLHFSFNFCSFSHQAVIVMKDDSMHPQVDDCIGKNETWPGSDWWNLDPALSRLTTSTQETDVVCSGLK